MTCTSVVQMSAAVVRTTTSLGPGSGIGFSMTPTSPTFRSTKARTVGYLSFGGRARAPECAGA